jgi:hypothetical protein
MRRLSAWGRKRQIADGSREPATASPVDFCIRLRFSRETRHEREDKMEDIQNNENVPKSENRHPFARLVWFVLFLVGFISLIAAVISTPYNSGVRGIVFDVTFMIPLFIGIPVTLLSLIFALVCRQRLNRFPCSVAGLLAYFSVIGCTLLILLAVSGIALLLGGGPLAAILWIPLFIVITATVFSIKSALVQRPSRWHISAMLLLAHILLFALNFVVGAIACC